MCTEIGTMKWNLIYSQKTRSQHLVGRSKSCKQFQKNIYYYSQSLFTTVIRRQIFIRPRKQIKYNDNQDEENANVSNISAKKWIRVL